MMEKGKEKQRTERRKHRNELIRTSKFDEKIKNCLRDYYNYGFHNINHFQNRKTFGKTITLATINGDWRRLNNIIADYVEWSEDNHIVMYATQDAQSLSTNPFQRVYRFCAYKWTYPIYFFHAIALLSPVVAACFDEETITLEDLEKVNTIMHNYKRTVKNEFLTEDTYNEEVKTLNARFDEYWKNETIKYKTSFFVEHLPKDFAPEGNNKNLNYNIILNRYHNLKVIDCEQSGSDSKKSANGDHNWKSNSLTMNRIIMEGCCQDKSFEMHFLTFLDFFSRYYIFGEVGTFLLKRLKFEEDSPFRFKHDYYSNVLNDYNLIDLLTAMEDNNWCIINYKHAITEKETKLLCFPLEIRISSVTGREYLMFYEPIKRRCSSIRIEFIESIKSLTEKKIVECLEKNQKEESDIDIENLIRKDKENAREIIGHSWGVSLNSNEGKQDVDTGLTSIMLQIRYDKNNEEYINRRLNHERRKGRLDYVNKEDTEKNVEHIIYTTTVMDPVEMRPWIRGFYGRIENVEGLDSENFSIIEDVNNLYDQICFTRKNEDKSRIKSNDKSKLEEENNPINWSISELLENSIGSGSEMTAHDKLFHEFFGIDYFFFADVISKLCCLNYGSVKGYISEDELDELVKNSLKELEWDFGINTNLYLRKEIKKILIEGAFIIEKTVADEKMYYFAYATGNTIDFYRDVIPLSEFEIRWLLSALDDQKADYFLSESEKQIIKALIKKTISDVKRIPVEKVNYFDRYKIDCNVEKNEKKYISIILKAIREGIVIQIQYETNQDGIVDDVFIPVVLEFSKRNNRFQLYCLDNKYNEIKIINLSSIISIDSKAKWSFDKEKAKTTYASYRRRMIKKVEVLFYEDENRRKNLADRLLMEFTPWKKLCRYNEKTGEYQLTISYHEADETDIVTRLLGYGASIRIKDYNDGVGLVIRNRVKRQKLLFDKS